MNGDTIQERMALHSIGSELRKGASLAEWCLDQHLAEIDSLRFRVHALERRVVELIRDRDSCLFDNGHEDILMALEEEISTLEAEIRTREEWTPGYEWSVQEANRCLKDLHTKAPRRARASTR